MTKFGLYSKEQALKLNNDYRHFVIESNMGLQIVEDASLKYAYYVNNRKNFAKRYGCSLVFTRNENIIGLAVDKNKEPLQGIGGVIWKRCKLKNIDESKYDCWVPDKGRKVVQKEAYEKITKEMESLCLIDPAVIVSEKLHMETMWTSDAPNGRMYIHRPFLFDIDGVFILSYKNPPSDMKIADDVREISHAEFLKAALL